MRKMTKNKKAYFRAVGNFVHRKNQIENKK